MFSIQFSFPVTHGCTFQTSLQHVWKLIGISHRILCSIVGWWTNSRSARSHPFSGIRWGNSRATFPVPHHGNADEFNNARGRLMADKVRNRAKNNKWNYFEVQTIFLISPGGRLRLADGRRNMITSGASWTFRKIMYELKSLRR